MRFGPGFHEPEFHEGEPFRWMAREAHLELEPSPEPRFLELDVSWIDAGDEPTLTLETGSERNEHRLAAGRNVVSVPLPAGAAAVRLGTDRVLTQEAHPGDGRELALRLRHAQVHAEAARHAQACRRQEARLAAARTLSQSLLAEYRRTAGALRLESGFHDVEVDEGQAFRWMTREAVVVLPPAQGPRFLELQVSAPFRPLSVQLAMEADGCAAGQADLAAAWNTVSFALPSGTSRLRLQASRWREAGQGGDPRELAIQVRWPLLHADEARHGHVVRQHLNRCLNYTEMARGEVRLSSTPWKLGIDMVGTCNVKPPCVYCNWDEAKRREGADVSAPFDLDTLGSYGEFFENATELVNCSIGEPFMMKDVDLLLDAFGRRGKLLEVTTNGQILTDANIRKLLGRNAHLYISLDAATPETYARLRNDAFPRLLDNVRRLVQAKGGRGQLPLVYLVFMPMKANLHEVDDFVQLCAELEADRLVLRPLNASEGMDLVWDREGYHYDYQRELLPFDDLVRVSGRVAELCRRLGVELSDQMDFGGSMAAGFGELYEEGRRQGAQVPLRVAPLPPSDGLVWGTARRETEPSPAGHRGPAQAAPTDSGEPSRTPTAEEGPRLPICTEPWTSLYVLRRGTLPCCYGGPVLGPMASFQQSWNAPLVQDIRRELSRGRFHRYCFDSPDCPLVRKAREGEELTSSQTALLLARRGLARLRRAGATLLQPLRRR